MTLSELVTVPSFSAKEMRRQADAKDIDGVGARSRLRHDHKLAILERRAALRRRWAGGRMRMVAMIHTAVISKRPTA